MNYSELKQIFQELKATSTREDLTAHVIFTEDSFAKPYPLLSRTYRVSSDNKAFWPNMGGYSIFAYCLDKTSDQGVRLDWYMAEEGNADGWKVEDFVFDSDEQARKFLVSAGAGPEELRHIVCLPLEIGPISPKGGQIT